MSDLSVQNYTLKVTPIKPDAPGFLDEYQQMLAVRRAFAEPMKAQPEDIDLARTLLAAHISEPEAPAAKMAVLRSLSANDVGKLLEIIMGANIVPPQNGAA